MRHDRAVFRKRQRRIASASMAEPSNFRLQIAGIEDHPLAANDGISWI